MGPGDYTPLYDDDLRSEVLAFQRSAGLEADGMVGANTLEMEATDALGAAFDGTAASGPVAVVRTTRVRRRTWRTRS